MIWFQDYAIGEAAPKAIASLELRIPRFQINPYSKQIFVKLILKLTRHP
ncbi:MAG: hypothetical protein F6K65_04015 [Moorea sp. SIO3C2]|nr:hypothetical protein [Moorena sp. SIO3C2]